MAPDTHNFHSQLVGWAKIVLPLCALGLLSTLFLFARGTNEPVEFPLAEVEAIARDQRVSSPEFSGVTDNGAIVVITAKTARPDTAQLNTVSIDDMWMRMDNTDGSHIEVTATSGQVLGRDRIARFSGLARMETSTGYQMETSALTANLNSGIIVSDGLIEVRAPFGTLVAGKVSVQMTQQNTAQQMLFTDGVRLLYNPQ